MPFKVPNSINVGYLNVPQFMAKEICIECNGDISEEQCIDIFEDPALKFPFVEIRIINADSEMFDIVRRLINCSIPFHYNYTCVEDMEIEYWSQLVPNAHYIEGFVSTDAVIPELKIDAKHLNTHLHGIKAQLVLLDNSVDNLLEVREIHDYKL